MILGRFAVLSDHHVSIDIEIYQVDAICIEESEQSLLQGKIITGIDFTRMIWLAI